VNVQVIKSGDSIAQNFVVSASALGAILSEIRELEGNKRSQMKRTKNPSIMKLDVRIKTRNIT